MYVYDLLRLILEALRTDLGLARRTLTGRRGVPGDGLGKGFGDNSRTCGSRNNVETISTCS